MDLLSFCEGESVKLYGELTADRKETCKELCESVVACAHPEKWKESIELCVAKPDNILKLKVLDGVSELVVESGLRDFDAALYYHSME